MENIDEIISKLFHPKLNHEKLDIQEKLKVLEEKNRVMKSLVNLLRSTYISIFEEKIKELEEKNRVLKADRDLLHISTYISIVDVKKELEEKIKELEEKLKVSEEKLKVSEEKKAKLNERIVDMIGHQLYPYTLN
jgi:hypothetical protein